MFTNYRYYYTNNKVIAVSTYAGKTVRGVAICAPGDEFNLEFGKKLAAARCNEKVAAKRYERASKKLNDLLNQEHELDNAIHKTADYYHDSYLAYNEAAQAVDCLIASLAK